MSVQLFTSNSTYTIIFIFTIIFSHYNMHHQSAIRLSGPDDLSLLLLVSRPCVKIHFILANLLFQFFVVLNFFLTTVWMCIVWQVLWKHHCITEFATLHWQIYNDPPRSFLLFYLPPLLSQFSSLFFLPILPFLIFR